MLGSKFKITAKDKECGYAKIMRVNVKQVTFNEISNIQQKKNFGNSISST